MEYFNINLFSIKTLPLNRLFAVHSELRLYLTEPSSYYPKFRSWYKKVYWQMLTGNRAIIAIYNKHRLAGFAIIKDTIYEKKICTFKVEKQFRKNGIATILMLATINELKYGNIHITIPDFLNDEFCPIMKKFRFQRISRIDSYYVEKHSEFFYRLNLSSILHNEDQFPLARCNFALNSKKNFH